MLNHIPFDFGNKIDNSNVENVRFDYYLFQRKRSIRNVSVSDSFEAVNQKLPVKFLVHGWTEHNYVKWYQDITKAYLKKGNYNIIGVDWSKIGDASYVDASMQVEQAGKKIGDWIIRLHKRKKVPYKSFHLVSHSLGCQVSGFIGKRVFNVTGKKLGRITALDAASPIFELVYGEEGRLDKGDAEFVDAVHSDGGVLGFKSSIGTVDFFPNGGSAVQPGCSLLKPDVKYEDCKSYFLFFHHHHQFAAIIFKLIKTIFHLTGNCFLKIRIHSNNNKFIKQKLFKFSSTIHLFLVHFLPII